MASCTGTVKQVPGMTFEATLFRIADQPIETPARQRVGGPTAPNLAPGAATGLRDPHPIPLRARL